MKIGLVEPPIELGTAAGSLASSVVACMSIPMTMWAYRAYRSQRLSHIRTYRAKKM